MHYFFWLLCFSLLTLTNLAHAKVRILTFHYNKPDFIELQYKACKKFLLDDYELIVFNDAKLPEYVCAIEDTCARFGLKCVRYEPEWHELDPLNIELTEWLLNPLNYSHVSFKRYPDFASMHREVSTQASVRHSHVIQYALDHYGYTHSDTVVILDGDAFPIRPISIKRDLLGGGTRHLCGIQKIISEENVDYLWVPFIAINMPKIPDKQELRFSVGVINDKLYDTGAKSYNYLKNHPSLNVLKVHGHSSTCFYNMPIEEMYLHGFNDNEIELTKTLPWPLCVEFHISHCFLHFGASSFSLEGHEEKSQCVTQFINKICKY